MAGEGKGVVAWGKVSMALAKESGYRFAKMTNGNEIELAEELFLDIIADASVYYDYDKNEFENENSIRLICSDFLCKNMINFDKFEIRCIKFAQKNIIYYSEKSLTKQIEVVRLYCISKIFKIIKIKKKEGEYNSYNDGKYTMMLGMLMYTDKLNGFAVSELIYDAYDIGIKPKFIKEILESRIKNFHVKFD